MEGSVPLLVATLEVDGGFPDSGRCRQKQKKCFREASRTPDHKSKLSEVNYDAQVLVAAVRAAAAVAAAEEDSIDPVL